MQAKHSASETLPAGHEAVRRMEQCLIVTHPCLVESVIHNTYVRAYFLE